LKSGEAEIKVSVKVKIFVPHLDPVHVLYFCLRITERLPRKKTPCKSIALHPGEIQIYILNKILFNENSQNWGNH